MGHHFFAPFFVGALLPVFLIGLYVVCLGTHWKRARSKLMRRLTWRPWFNKLPPF
jgi:hypothetical protein